MAILLAFLAFLIGIAAGIVLNWSRFCAWLAFHDWQNNGDSRRLMALMLIIGMAVGGTQMVALFGNVDMSSSILLVPAFSWTGAMLGGAAFGFGMVLAKGDPLRHLQKFASGNLASLQVLFWSVLTFAILANGLLAPIRELASHATWIDLSGAGTATQSLSDLVATAGVAPEYVAAIGGGVFFVCFALPALFNAALRRTGRLLTGAMMLGLIVPVLWWISSPGATGAAGSAKAHAINPVSDMALMLASLGGERAMDSTAGFTLGLVIGCLLHASITGMLGNNLRQYQPIGRRGFTGALMMGGGAAFAGGGIWGAGISGLSVLALGSVATVIAIILGATIGARMVDGEDQDPAAKPMPGSKEAGIALAKKVAASRKKEQKPVKEEQVEVVVEASFAAPNPKTTITQRKTSQPPASKALAKPPSKPSPKRRKRKSVQTDAEPRGMADAKPKKEEAELSWAMPEPDPKAKKPIDSDEG